jgi:hypothetical protein
VQPSSIGELIKHSLLTQSRLDPHQLFSLLDAGRDRSPPTAPLEICEPGNTDQLAVAIAPTPVFN